MRKIISKEIKEKNKRRNQIIVVSVLIGIMIIGTLGYAFQGKEEEAELKKITHNGLEFYKQNNFWVTVIDNEYLVLSNNPEDTKSFNSHLRGIEEYRNQPLYIYSEDSYS